MFTIDTDFVRQKTAELMDQMGVSKGKLGEVLGSKGDHANVRINRANRFLTAGKRKITLEEINRLAEFFGKPVSYFLFDDTAPQSELCASEKEGKPAKEMPMREIEKNLRKLGFDEAFVANQVELLNAMQVYRDGRKKKKNR